MDDLETLQQSFMESMDSMQKNFAKEKKELEDKYEAIKKEKESFEEMFRENIKKNSEEINALKKKNKELQNQVSGNIGTNEEVEELKRMNKDLSSQLGESVKNKEKCIKLEKELSSKNEEIKKNEEKVKNLEEKIKELEDKLKEFDDIKDAKQRMKEMSDQINNLKNQIFLDEKQKKDYKEQKENLEKIVKEKDDNLNKLSEDIKKFEKQNKELLEYVKKSKEDEEKKKIDEEKMRIEREKLESLKREEEKRKEEERKRKEEEEEEKSKSEKKDKNEMDDEKKNKFLTDILCEFLSKLNNSQYFLSVFDLLNKCLKNFDELNYFSKMALKYNYNINDLLFNFFTNLKSYIILTGKDSSIKNLLAQKTFKYSDIDKDDIETLKKIKNVKMGENNILEIYKKKRDLFFQKVGLTFDLLKEKILSEENKDTPSGDTKTPSSDTKTPSGDKNNNELPELLNIKKPPTELFINFDQIDTIKLAPFISFQISNIFTKLENLSIEVSKVNLDIFYSLIFNCLNLKSIKISLNNKEKDAQNENNIEILNSIIQLIFTFLKNIKEFSYTNITLLNKYLPDIVLSIKNSKLQKLTLSGCFTSKEDIAMFNSYFSGENDLTEIDFSNHDFNIPSLLGNSLLNYQISKKLTSINFSNCNLIDEDFEIISKYVSENNLIKYCNLSNNKVSQKSCFKLGTMVEKSTSLEKLLLNNCDLNGETSLLLFNSKGSSGLKYLDISGNTLGDIGLMGICPFIKNCPKLEIFELKEVGGNDMGFNTLINCVKSTTSIKEIHFENNKITKVSYDMIKGLNEEFKNKGVKFFANKIEGQNELDSLKFV